MRRSCPPRGCGTTAARPCARSGRGCRRRIARPEHGDEERDRRPVPRPPPVRGEVDRRCAHTRVRERLEHGHSLLPRCSAFMPTSVSRRACPSPLRAPPEGRAVLDEPALAAVPPHEVGDLVDVGGLRWRSRRGRPRERRERRGRAAERPPVGEGGQRRGRRVAERAFEHGRREAVDDDEDELARRHLASVRSPACRSGLAALDGPRGRARPRRARSRRGGSARAAPPRSRRSPR